MVWKINYRSYWLNDRQEPMGIARKKEKKQSMVVPSSSRNCCDKERQMMINKKTRRCWSPDLHKSFLQALQQLGGAQGELNDTE